MTSRATFAAAVAVALGVAHAASWKEVLPGNNAGTVLMGVTMMKDGKTGFVGGSETGVGPFIRRTTNGFQDGQYVAVGHQYDILFSSGAVSEEGAAVAGGFLNAEYSTSANAAGPFASSAGGAGGPTQCVKSFGKNSFSVTAQSMGYNGIALSTNGGKNYTKIDIFTSNFTQGTFAAARFAAHPSESTIYVTAGNWPSQSDADDGFVELNQFRAINPQTGKARNSLDRIPTMEGADDDQDDDKSPGVYSNVVAKSTDGGKTWVNLASAFKVGEYYPNAISCGDDNHCVFTAEAADGSVAGSYIFTTSDGGETWNQTMTNTNIAGEKLYSMLDVHFISKTEVYASGASDSKQSGVTGYFYHSTDAGMTWSIAATLPNVYLQYLNFPTNSADLAFATGVDYSTRVEGVFSYQ